MLSNVLVKLLNRCGLHVSRIHPPSDRRFYPPDFDEATVQTIIDVRSYTMVSPERLQALCQAVAHITMARIPGAIVECGVWRGGCMMAVAKQLLALNDRKRDLYLFDTFSGMTPPTTRDTTILGEAATDLLNASRKVEGASVWCVAGKQDVAENMSSTGYPQDRIHLVEGRVEESLPQSAPKEIALLRLDTDWYASTKHEMEHLFPRLMPGGILIIDDYGHWQGCRQAVDEYLLSHQIDLFLARSDYTGRIGVKR